MVDWGRMVGEEGSGLMKKLFLVLFFVLVNNTNSYAACGTPELHHQYKESSVVFLGEVIAPEDKTTSSIATFKVHKMYKGRFRPEIKIKSFSGKVGGGGIYEKKSNKFVVFAQMQGNSFDSATNKPDYIYTKMSCWGIIDNRPETIRFLEQQIKYVENLEASLPIQDALKAKAEHYFYWEDFENAALVLDDMYRENPTDKWILEAMMKSNYRANYPEKIWDAFINSKELNLELHQSGGGFYLKYIGFAAFVLGKEYETYERLTSPTFYETPVQVAKRKDDVVVVDVLLTGISKKNSVIRAHFQNSVLIQVDFSGGVLKGNLYSTRFGNSDLRNVQFGDMEMKDVQIVDSKLEGADLSNAQIKNITLDRTTYNDQTKWPKGFNPRQFGALTEEELKKIPVPLYIE